MSQAALARLARQAVEAAGWRIPRTDRRGRPGKRSSASCGHGSITGRVARDRSNERWCSDILHLACWSGEVVEIAFALDCGDRECLAVVGYSRALTGADIRALMHAAVAARSGAFVHTLKRNYGSGADLRSAAAVLEQLPRWIADYNAVAPHSALGYDSPLGYRKRQRTMVTP